MKILKRSFQISLKDPTHRTSFLIPKSTSMRKPLRSLRLLKLLEKSKNRLPVLKDFFSDLKMKILE